MLKLTRNLTLRLLQTAGIFRVIENSEWRKNRLLILCYHGISLKDEHLWRPNLYMEPTVLKQRLGILKRGPYHVLPLKEALRRLKERDLPPCSVAITFDDGGYDFYKAAFPILKSHGFPVTVYQSTYYGDYQKPVFNLVCSYLLWTRRGTVLEVGGELGLSKRMDLTTENSRAQIVRIMVLNAEASKLTGAQKNDMAARLARLLDISYDEILAARLFQLMNSSERSQLAAQGVDFQLHTHRHRTPLDETLFRKEIQDNRRSLRELGSNAIHFCYPSGIYRPEFFSWLKSENVVSATTCDAGLASSQSNPLLLPRLVETPFRTAVEFEAWLNGLASLLAFRKTARAIVPAAAGQASQITDR